MFVQESHARFERDRDLLLGGAAVVGEEDGFAADAALGGGCQVEQECPGCLARHGSRGGVEGERDVIGVVV
ncbi:hypothetical protein COL154_000530 [Colletotrichum chrysophilum]|nr:hypothetical protein COL154_000530 [Colletotrichum chrysophilum]